MFCIHHLFHLSLLQFLTRLMISYWVVRFYGYGLCLWYSDWYSIIYLYRKHRLISQYKYLVTSTGILQFNIDQVHSSHLLCEFSRIPILCFVGTSIRNLCKYLFPLPWNRTPWQGKAQLLKSWSQVLPPWSWNLHIRFSGLNIVSSCHMLNRSPVSPVLPSDPCLTQS